MTSPSLDQRAADLRRAFDNEFSREPRSHDVVTEDFLDVRVDGEPYALSVQHISGVVARKLIVPLPSARAELLGIAGIRGSIIPVYSLAALLGRHGGVAAPEWLALSSGRDPLGFAFDEVVGLVRISREEISVAAGEALHVRNVARINGKNRPIIDLRDLVEDIVTNTGTNAGSKE